MPLRTHYDVLSVREDARHDEIREKYKTAILSSHPDKLLCAKSATSSHHPTGNQKEVFLDVQKAWEVLSDPKSRENYDSTLQASRYQAEFADDEIRLEEMGVQDDGDMRELSYECRCGDYYWITTVELEEIGVFDGSMTQASVVLPCESCSLKLRVLIN